MVSKKSSGSTINEDAARYPKVGLLPGSPEEWIRSDTRKFLVTLKISMIIPSTSPFVSIIMPVRNEREFIVDTLTSILCGTYPANKTEIILADGMSEDGTQSVVQEFAARSSVQIRLIENPEKIVSTGLNRAVRAAQGELILRMDAHTEYAPDYVEQCVRVLHETGADNVGGPWRAEGRDSLQRAIALAFHSPFSSGGARSHQLSYEGEVDAVYLGCWRREVFQRVGLFDEDLVRNQDDEFSFRMKLAGMRLWQTPRIKSTYWPRSSLKKLFHQYYQYGFWKVAVIRKHRQPASWRHLVPALFVLGLILGPLMAGIAKLVDRPLEAAFLWFIFVAVVSGYACLLLFAGLAAVMLDKPLRSWASLPYLPFVFLIYHLAYGTGFLLALILPQKLNPQASVLTR
jgi:succinoglycan biosynthesis protein ExoA